MQARANARASNRALRPWRSPTLPVLPIDTGAAALHFPPEAPFPRPVGAPCRSRGAQLDDFEIFFLSPRSAKSPLGQRVQGRAGNAVAGRDEGQSVSSTRLPAISTTAVTMHLVPLDGTDGKVANEPSRVRVSVVEPSGTWSWTFGLGKNRDTRHSPSGIQ